MFKNASCLGQPTVWWFPERNGKSSIEIREVFANTKKAVTICCSCPCLDDCIAYSLNNYEVGIWGGMGEKLRKRARYMHRSGASIPVIRKKLLGSKVA